MDGQSNADVLKHELVMLDVMTANRDQAIWAAAEGSDVTIDDSNVPPPVKVISNVGGGSTSSSAAKEGSVEYLSPEESLAKIRVPEGYELNVFASEEQFPDLANPVQMQVDAKGRLWVASWNTYPKWEPVKEMNDSLMILEDTDRDGMADTRKIFAHVHNPLGFEFWGGGVLVTSGPGPSVSQGHRRRRPGRRPHPISAGSGHRRHAPRRQQPDLRARTAASTGRAASSWCTTTRPPGGRI